MLLTLISIAFQFLCVTYLYALSCRSNAMHFEVRNALSNLYFSKRVDDLTPESDPDKEILHAQYLDCIKDAEEIMFKKTYPRFYGFFRYKFENKRKLTFRIPQEKNDKIQL